MNDYLIPAEVAARLRTSLGSLAKWRYERRGPPYHKFGRRVLYKRDELESWEREQMQQVTS